MNPREIEFQAGIWTVFGLALAFAVITSIWIPLGVAVTSLSPWIELLTEVGKFVALAVVILFLLRIEGVTLAEIGFSRRHIPPALIAFGIFWVAMNLLGFALAVGFGNEWGLDFIWYIPEQVPFVERYGPLPGTWVIFILLNYLVIGVVEEVAFRGYLQSKVIALVGGNSRLAIAVGILVTTIVFGLMHTPAAIVDGQSLSGVIATAALPTVTAVFFGVIYELTQNLPFVALLHGFGNSWPLVMHWGDWSGTSLLAFWVGTAVIYVAVTLGYRYWVRDTVLTAVVSRADTKTALR